MTDDPQAPRARDVLIGRTRDGQRLLVISRAWAEAEMTTWATLRAATTFGELQVDDDAAALVAAHTDGYLQRLADTLAEESGEEVDPDDPAFVAEHTGPEAPYRIDLIFEGDDELIPVPDPRVTSDQWLREHLADAYDELGEPEEDWGFDYEPLPSVPADRRTELERAVRAAGWNPLWVDELHDQYESGDLQVPS